MEDHTLLHNKSYVLDTNVLLHDPQALFNFDNSEVIIPMTVVEELEKFKRETSDRGKNSRECIRELDKLRLQGPLSEGVLTTNNSKIRVLLASEKVNVPVFFHQDVADNEILLTALAVKQQGKIVKFISKDLAARIKADVLGLESEDYLKGFIPRDEFYKGWTRIQVPAIQLKKDIPDDLIAATKQYPFVMNEYVIVEAQHNPHNYRVFCYIGGPSLFRIVQHPQLVWNLGARNPQQLMALDALFNPELQFVSLLGPAGTGKTFLALLAGLHQIIAQHRYKKMLVSRPVVPLGPDIGYLPGDIQEKMHSWMQPVYDNVEVILHAALAQEHLEEVRKEALIESESYKKEKSYDKHDKHDKYQEQARHKHKKHNHDKEKKEYKYHVGSVDDLVKAGKLSLEAITYMRGRSIPYQFILIDEVQNLSPHEVKTIVSRVGQASKIILCGDPYQIDSPYLDFSSNGLVVASDKFKGQNLFATVFLDTSERGVLSKLAGELL